MKSTVQIYDTTLRDGTQGEGINLSVDDKLRIARRLDDFGMHYIEGGWPGSNPKDASFFERARDLRLSHARMAAFGSTRKAHGHCESDAQIQMLLEAGTPVVTLVGKTSRLHVTHVLETSLAENLAMIRDSVAYLKAQGREVMHDAEHYFDGFKLDKDYALATLRAAVESGADWLVLCETNGGTMPWELSDIVREIDRVEIGYTFYAQRWQRTHVNTACKLLLLGREAAVRRRGGVQDERVNIPQGRGHHGLAFRIHCDGSKNGQEINDQLVCFRVPEIEQERNSDQLTGRHLHPLPEII